MTTTPYEPGDDAVAPDPLAPDALDDDEPDAAEGEDDSEDSAGAV
jgi:hypothetical protein